MKKVVLSALCAAALLASCTNTGNNLSLIHI